MEQINIRAVEMVRNIRNIHYEEVKDMSRRDRILFYHKKAARLHDRFSKQRIKQRSQQDRQPDPQLQQTQKALGTETDT